MDSNIVQSLESHAVVLEAELREIRDDVHQLHIMTRKYGIFRAAMNTELQVPISLMD